MFADLEIATDLSFEKHLNKYPVIFLDLTNFVTEKHEDDIVEKMDAALLADVSKAYTDIPVESGDRLMDYLLRVYEVTRKKTVFIIDEWDAICREYDPDTKVMDRYVDWLRRMFKSQDALRVFASVSI